MRTIHVLAGAALTAGLLAAAARAEDWAQAAANPARTARVSDQAAGPMQVAWVRQWDSQVFHNTSQPIIAGERLFIGSANGVVHAVDLHTGEDIWAAGVDGPIVHALACDARRVFAATMGGSIWALDATTGEELWKRKLSRKGFCTAPLLLEGTVSAGGRDGAYYCLDAQTGELRWQTSTGAPIDQTSAADQGRIVFVNKAMTAWCLDAATGEPLWTVENLPGSSVRDYWPVIHQGKVVIRTQEAGPRELTGSLRELQTRYFYPDAASQNPDPATMRFRAKTAQDVLHEQAWLQQYYQQNPHLRTLVVLNLEDGKEPYTVGIVGGCCNTGTLPPPVLASDGRLYTPLPSSAGKRGLLNITGLILGHLNLQTGRMDQPFLCAAGDLAGIAGKHTPFELTSDETVTLSSGGDIVWGIRGDTTPGGINIRTGETFAIKSLPDLPRAHDMMPGGNGIAVSGRYIAFMKNRHVICIRGSGTAQALGNAR